MTGFSQDFRNVFSSSGRGYIQLIVLNILVFLGLNVLSVTFYLLGWQSVKDIVLSQFELSADATKLLYRPWTLVTYAFWHADVLHIFFNMLALYWFGQIFEEYVGKKRLWSVYLLSAVVGGFAYLCLFNFVPALHNQILTKVLLGASGAVYGVVVATATLLPTYTFFLLLIGAVQIRYIAALYVILSYIGLSGGNAGGNMAHLGGALMGFIFTMQLQRGNDMGAWIYRFWAWVGKPFRPKPKMKATYKAKEKATVNQTKAKTASQGHSQTSSTQDVPNQEEIDAILDKISASGYDSLTKEEKQKLFKASNS